VWRPIIALRDDGRGFAAGDPQANEVAQGHGLRNMHVRAQEIGAQLQIDSNVSAGTLVTVRLPL
jgi:signal transduction histidine kinase